MCTPLLPSKGHQPRLISRPRSSERPARLQLTDPPRLHSASPVPCASSSPTPRRRSAAAAAGAPAACACAPSSEEWRCVCGGGISERGLLEVHTQQQGSGVLGCRGWAAGRRTGAASLCPCVGWGMCASGAGRVASPGPFCTLAGGGGGPSRVNPGPALPGPPTRPVCVQCVCLACSAVVYAPFVYHTPPTRLAASGIRRTPHGASLASCQSLLRKISLLALVACTPSQAPGADPPCVPAAQKHAYIHTQNTLKAGAWRRWKPLCAHAAVG